MLRKYIISLAFFFWISHISFGFEIDGSKWIGGKTDFYINITGISRSGVPWNTAFIQAINNWNAKTNFEINVVREYRDPCVKDALNSAAFVDNMCGREFGASALAVTLLRYETQLLGPAAIIEADIYVKKDIDFDIFDGANLLKNFYPVRTDFRRAVLHELGHVIGLNHETGVSAIMQPEYGNIYRLQEDDILGANTLYGGLSNCDIQALRLGLVIGTLDHRDCTVQELTVGGSDNSFIDIYKFSLSSPTDLDFKINSSELESVIIIADNNLNYLTADSEISGGCDANLRTKLVAGEYFLLVNTYDNQVKKDCGVTGNYELSVNYHGDSQQQLGPSISSTGNNSASSFSGNVTADRGKSFGNKFRPEDSLDISATISIDPIHRNEEGFIVVAAVIGNKILLLNEKGSFIDSELVSGPLISHAIKNLEAVEIIQIVSNLIAAEFGISQITVDFFVGYGLLAEPTEIFFHETPLNLIISASDK